MYIIREVVNCRPGKIAPMLDKFKTIGRAMREMGHEPFRLLSDVTRVISDHGVNILSAAVTTSRDRVAKLHFTFEMGDPGHLGHVVRAVQRIDGVFDAHRVTGSRAH